MKLTKEQLKEASLKLKPCPFCGGEAGFEVPPKNPNFLFIRHYPASGVNCPALFEQYCDDFEMGTKWWNTRT